MKNRMYIWYLTTFVFFTIMPLVAQSQPSAQEIAKLQRVISSLHANSQKGITNGSPEVFLADLKDVLTAVTEGLLILVD